MTQTHTPMIGTHDAVCSCHNWRVPSRRDDETQGDFTKRAYEAHNLHAAYRQASLLADHQTLFDGGAL